MKSVKEKTPYGSWRSPLTSELLSQGTLSALSTVSEISLDGADLYWLELRSKEGGRNVIMRRDAAGDITDITPPGFNVRTRVHEYGGGAFIVSNRNLYFSNFSDGCLYCQRIGEDPVKITSSGKDIRYADLIVDSSRKRIICVQEYHEDGKDPINRLVSVKVDEEGGEPITLLAGYDFYSSPRLSPDGSTLAWTCWNHPSLPFFCTELWIGKLSSEGSIKEKVFVAGGENESVVKPQWSPDGFLHLISDRTGWWNLYRLRDRTTECLLDLDADFSGPEWVFGTSSYDFQSKDQLICTYTQKGIWHLALLNTTELNLEPIESEFTDFEYMRSNSAYAYFIAAGPLQSFSIFRFDLEAHRFELIYPKTTLEINSDYFSTPEAIEFPTKDLKTAHGFFYLPKNRDYTGPDGELPPLIVITHGGPTGAASAVFTPEIQFWTTRGFAVLDLNYGGSTGYGRDYRQRLDGQWGIVDVDDCTNGALFLARTGKVDGNKLIIRGRSAGGYTTLCALIFRNTFRAGASYFGLSDLESLAKQSHKFESHYLDRLIGPYPEMAEVYRSRSPINYVDKFSAPVIFFQGLDDKVVLPTQAEAMVDSLRKNGLPVAYVPFEGEQHGFRRSENIKRSYDSELFFYSRVLGFPLTDPVEPVKIENL